MFYFFNKSVHSNPYAFHDLSQSVFTDPKKQFTFLYSSNLEPQELIGDPSGATYIIMFSDKTIKDPNKNSAISFSKIPDITLFKEEQSIKQNTQSIIKKTKINGNDAEFIKVEGTYQLLYILIQGNGYVVIFRDSTYYLGEQAPKLESDLIKIASTFKQISNK